MAIPALLMAWWASWLVGWLWRRTLWQRIGADARKLAGEGVPVPVWAGWRVAVGGGSVTWRGGLLGVSTTVRTPGGRRRYDHLLDEAAARVAIAGPMS